MEKQTKKALEVVMEERDRLQQRSDSLQSALDLTESRNEENSKKANLYNVMESRLKDLIKQKQVEIDSQTETIRDYEVVLELEKQSQFNFYKLYDGMKYLLNEERLTEHEIQRLKELYPDELFEQMYTDRRKQEIESPDWIQEMDGLKEQLSQKDSEINHLLVQLG